MGSDRVGGAADGFPGLRDGAVPVGQQPHAPAVVRAPGAHATPHTHAATRAATHAATQVQLDLISDYYDELSEIGLLIMRKVGAEGADAFDLKQLAGMMNSALYCAAVLRSWSELPTFLELEYFQAKGVPVRADEVDIDELARHAHTVAPTHPSHS